MLSLKRICSLQSIRILNRNTSSDQFIREFSSKKRNKNKLNVIARNDFVTHQLNSTFSAYVKRQKTILRSFQEDESKEFHYQKHLNDNNYEVSSKQFYRSERKSVARNQKKHVYNHNKPGGTRQFDNQQRKINDRQPNASKSYPKSHITAYESDDFDDDDDSDEMELEQLEASNWEEIKLVAIVRHVYESSAMTKNRSDADIEAKHIQSVGEVPKPIFKFNELDDLPRSVIDELESMKLSQCTPIQSQGIPIALSGANLISISPPKSGRALAMILSALVHITYQAPMRVGDGPVAVILATTEEVAEDIRQLANKFGRHFDLNCSLLRYSPNKKYVHSNSSELVITTPCHLYELLRTKSLNLHRCSHIAFYEADKMLDIGLNDELAQIETQIRPDCQRVTWNTRWIHELTNLAIDGFVRLEAGSSEITVNLSPDIKQTVKLCEELKKVHTLHEILDSIELHPESDRKTLIFAEDQKKADQIVKIIQTRRCECKCIHNLKSTDKRASILDDFQQDKFQYLALTDAAAKNVDFTKINNVINFDMPYIISDYISRVKRIRNCEGTSFSIVTEEDGEIVADLIQVLQESQQTVDPALLIMKAANADSDDEISYAIPKGKGFQKFTIYDDRNK